MADRIDSDGLPASDVGEWTLEKHERLRKYVDAAHGARRHFASRSYVDLYSGPGRSWIRETGEFADGSPLVAFSAGAIHGDQFTEFVLADANDRYLSAAEQRLRLRGATVRVFPGAARMTVDSIIDALDPRGLHLAFLDPYNLGDLPFEVISKLVQVRHMDLIVHVSVADLTRNLTLYLRSDSPGQLDAFVPNWRNHVDQAQRPDLIRQQIFTYWKAKIADIGATVSECVERVANSKNADLYWLVFVSRHPLAHKLWTAIANVSPQRRMFY